MTAGFDCDDSGDRPGDEDVMQEQTGEPDWYRYTSQRTDGVAAGEKIVYCSAKPNLAAGMLEKLAAEPLPEMFHRLVAKPMHMSNYHLFLTPTGTAYGGGGHHFTTRDFMKLTQLFLNDGKWEGRQIVSREWARKSSAALRQLSAVVRLTVICGTQSNILTADANCTPIFRAGTAGRSISGYQISIC